MDVVSLLETYISDANNRLLEEFLVTEWSTGMPGHVQACNAAIDDCFAILLGIFLIPNSRSEPALIDVTLAKIELIGNIEFIEDRISPLKYCWAQFSGLQLDKSQNFPARVSTLLSTQLLRLASWVKQHHLSTHRKYYYELINLARGMIQGVKIPPKSKNLEQIQDTIKWIEGTYIWQALAFDEVIQNSVQRQVLYHAKKVMVTTLGTVYVNPQSRKSFGNCLQNPTPKLLGCLCELLGLPLEAIWWYRKYIAENVSVTNVGLPPEMVEVLESEKGRFLQISGESRSSAIEFLAKETYESVLKKQDRLHVNAVAPQQPSTPVVQKAPEFSKFASLEENMPYPSPYFTPTLSTPSKSVNDSLESIPIGTGSKKETQEVMTPKKLIEANNLLASVHQQSKVFNSLSTLAFLEKSRRHLELSMAMPLEPLKSEVKVFPVLIEEKKLIENPETVLTQPIATTGTPPITGTPNITGEPPVVEKLPVEDNRTRLQRRIKLFGLVEDKEVPGDGNCQFSSLSDQLYHDFKHSGQIRSQVVAWYRENADLELENSAKLKEFGNDDEGWSHYCTVMSLSGTWGDHLTLVAAAELYKLRIVIISSVVDESQALIEIIPTVKPEQQSSLPVIFLCHYAEFHYGTLSLDPSWS